MKAAAAAANWTEAEADQHFDAYLRRHGRSYLKNSSEYQERRNIWLERKADVERKNSRVGRRWTAGLNHLSDRTEEEKRSLLGWKGTARNGAKRRGGRPTSLNIAQMSSSQHKKKQETSLPEEKIWTGLRNSMIRDQGSCGSCWAVSATTVLGYHSELHGTNRSFSTQDVVDCVPNPSHCGGTGGCDGATVELAFQYVMLKGVREPEENPYTSMDSQCNLPASSQEAEELQLVSFTMDAVEHKAARYNSAAGPGFMMQSWVKLPVNEYRPIMLALAQKGPLAVALAANNIFNYNSGIFDECDVVVNHAVTLIGYGKDSTSGDKYWVVQNSWGTSWGEEGTIRILRSDAEQDVCGTDMHPEEGIGCDGGPSEVDVCGTCGILYDALYPVFRNPTL